MALHPLKRGAAACALVGCLVGLGACIDDAPEPAEATTYEVHGVVQSVTPNRRYAVIAHETIPGFMDAMTMAFAVDDPDVLDGVARGDTIRFRIDVTDDEVVIRQIYAPLGER